MVEVECFSHIMCDVCARAGALFAPSILRVGFVVLLFYFFVVVLDLIGMYERGRRECEA